MSNKAAWIMKPKANPLEVGDAPMPKAGKGQVVIKNYAAAVNPVDWKIQDYDFFVKQYPFIVGEDVAGEVHEVGEGVTNVKKGDRVLAHAFALATGDAQQSGFQLYTLHPSIVVAKIPSSVTYASAAVLPLALSTAAACLFKKETLALAMPTEASKPAPSGKSVLVWGGSSSVGAAAIQLAAGAGHKVVSISSAHNVDKVKSLGAEVFDYKSSTVTEDIIKALEGTEYAGVCDCIGTPDAAEAWAKIYKKLGGRYGSVMPGAQGIPEGIKGESVFAPSVGLADKYIGDAVWAKWIPAALESGALKPMPEPKVIKGGLEAVQQGLDEQRKGVSFAKIVVEIQ